ncbi:MAG TPA: cupin domain-containing protein [Pseudonocardiaceae bacterium]|jgi:mannose-6-phosphate isomerase-like protein (cupin superfamily)|nr:cupin domain-containing protein [Pseudonocardiaceae bacterium]
MSVITRTDRAVVVREADAEVLGAAPSTVRLYADASSTGGALSSQRVTLGPGADGASPHHHTGSAELFFVLDGSLQVLAGDQVVTATEGDFLVVPPLMAHAFGALPGVGADVLIVITPGVERFEYFRLLDRVARGTASPQEILDSQERFDNRFLDSPVWRATRTAR